MKLFYAMGTCALAPHIVLAELGMAYELEAVNLKDKTCASGNYRSINPKGAVPALKMDNGEILTEGSVISQYLADQKTDHTLFAKFGSLERVRIQEWLNFITSDVHKNFSPLFSADRTYNSAETINEVKTFYKTTLMDKVSFISEKLSNNDYLLGKNCTIADAYMFTVLSWGKHVGLDFSNIDNVSKYLARVAARPAVIKAMKEQGMIK